MLTHPSWVRKLRKQLAVFLREKRGTLTLDQFAKKLGISDSSLNRLEMADQNLTIDTLERLLDRLGCEFGDVFKRERR